MKSKTILGADGATKMRQITVGNPGKGRRGRHKGNTAACRHGGQLKAVPDTTGSIRQIFTDYGVL